LVLASSTTAVLDTVLDTAVPKVDALVAESVLTGTDAALEKAALEIAALVPGNSDEAAVLANSVLATVALALENSEAALDARIPGLDALVLRDELD